MSTKTANLLSDEDAELLAMMQTDPDEAAANSDATVPEATLAVMSGHTEWIVVGDKRYELAAFAVTKLTEGYNLLYKCPSVLLAQALAAKDGHGASIADITEKFNTFQGRTGTTDTEDPDYDEEIAVYSEERIANIIGNFPSILMGTQGPEIIANILNVVVFALKRRHKTLTVADIEDDFDIGDFVKFVRALYRVNTGLKETF